ncbi:MAG: GAF domain-containing protein [Mycobacteriales bacterium]
MTASLRQETASSGVGALHLLSGVAASVGRGVDSDAVLAELAEGVRELLGADRVSLLLLDGQGRLAPAVAMARRPDGALYQRFRSMRPIPVADLPSAWETLAGERVVIVSDAGSSPLVPQAWQHEFGLSSLAIAPLRAADQPIGILVVDQPATGSMGPTQQALLEGAAALASLAVRALLPPGAAAAELAEAVATISSAGSFRVGAERALDALLALTRCSAGAIATLGRDQVEVLATRGTAELAPGCYPFSELPVPLATSCANTWAADPGAPIGWHAHGRDLLVLPLPANGRVRTVVVLSQLPPVCTARERLQEIGRVVGLALAERYTADQRARDARAATLVTGWSTLDYTPITALGELTGELQELTGTHLLDAVAPTRALAQASGLRRVTGELSAPLSAFRRKRHPAAAQWCAGRWLVPIIVGSRVLAALLLDDSPATRSDQHRLDCLLGGFAGVLDRAVDAAALARAEPILATTTARAQVAGRCYTELAQLLGALTTELREAASADPRVPVQRAQRLLTESRSLLHDATDALGDPESRHGLRAALSQLGERMAARGGPALVLHTTGRIPQVPAPTQVALLRACRDALFMFRNASAGCVLATLETGSRTITLTLCPDELFSPALDTDAAGLPLAFRRMRAWLDPVGASVVYTGKTSGRPVLTLTAPASATTGAVRRANEGGPRPTPLRPPPPTPCPVSGPAHLPEVVRQLS